MQLSYSLRLFLFILSEITGEYNLPPRRLQHSKLFSCLYGDLLDSDETDSAMTSEPGNLGQNDMGNEMERTVTTVDRTSSADEPNESLERNYSRLKADSIAQNAALVATAANEAQDSAAQDAAKRVKMQLAEKAIQASKAVEAVLEGKQVIVDNYEREIREANAVVCQVSSSLESSEANAENAQAVAKASECQLNNLKALMEEATSSLSDVESLGELAHTDLEKKTQLLATTKALTDRLVKQVAQAKEDYECVKASAYRAACAAVDSNKKAPSSGRTVRQAIYQRHRRGSKNHSKQKRHSSVRNGRRYREMIRGDAMSSLNERTPLQGRHFYRKCLESNFVNPI